MGATMVMAVSDFAENFLGPVEVKEQHRPEAAPQAAQEAQALASSNAEEPSDLTPEQEQVLFISRFSGRMAKIDQTAVEPAGDTGQELPKIEPGLVPEEPETLEANKLVPGPPPAGVMAASARVESMPTTALVLSGWQPQSDEAVARAVVAKYVKPIGLVSAGVAGIATVGGVLWMFNKWKNSGKGKSKGGKKKERRHARGWIVHEG